VTISTGRVVRIAFVSANAAVGTGVEALSEQEVRALARAAGWYAKYHERMIAEKADDRSAAAVAQREHFRDLHLALSKLGIRLRRPDGLGG
jgi:hypothetical protein